MKIYREWLQRYFDAELPENAALADALTFHAFEIESIENDVLDVKVTANRGHDCLSHRGIAKELAAILEIPMNPDPLRNTPDIGKKSEALSIAIAEPELCSRYIAAYIRGVKVGPSPLWLKESLEALGQRSINNVVDATNYVMFDLGQPLHAFDAGKLSQRDGAYAIEVHRAKKGEKMIALDDKEYALDESNLVIADRHDDVAIGIAGVKGGAPASITEETTDIIIESANFSGVSVRKTAQKLNLRTDASSRFEQGLSPELAAYAMKHAVILIRDLAGGELEGYVDEYPRAAPKLEASVPLAKIHRTLGVELSSAEIERALQRLDLSFSWHGGTIVVEVPFERLDLSIPEDLIEEIGRIIGYDKVPAIELPRASRPEVNSTFAAAEAVRERFISEGYAEVFTSVFTERGDRAVLNKVGGERPYLRADLSSGLTEAARKNMHLKDLLGIDAIRLFEIGTVWERGTEAIHVATAIEAKKGSVQAEEWQSVDEVLKATELPADRYETYPLSSAERYQPFSRYPFVVRDIALWVPEGTSSETVLNTIRAHAGDLLVRSSRFDEFKKDGRVSYAFRLVFQSFDKTLTDGEVNERMESVYAAARENAWEVR